MEQRIWNRIQLKGSVPSPRHSHTGVLYQDHYYIFGGFQDDQALDDLWIISLGMLNIITIYL